ncbi:xanthine dehydrogenase [Thraustotheca clavata]|uniref:Xanthine dehydrogenase n=1 Tax=Thraustotheca clavata TaxID=74557 RepID=A0A1V9ZWM9_9STRA|nr:xanthine dehydrogenase [Thraustotheca clavata]
MRSYIRDATRRVKDPMLGLPRLIYGVNLDRVGDDLKTKFVPLDCDEETDEFLSSCQDTSLFRTIASRFLNIFYSVTDTNGMLGRGQMFVFSSAQARQVFSFPNDKCGGKLLDIGAGDGNVTERLASFVDEIHTTEVSLPMVNVLNTKGFNCIHTSNLSHPDIIANGPYKLISLLNVLDRADCPLTLLKQIHDLLDPEGILLIAVVLPFAAFVETGTQKLAPKEELPMDGGLCEQRASFEDAARIMTEKVFVPNGFQVKTFSRVPYLCRGDISQPYYVRNHFKIFQKEREMVLLVYVNGEREEIKDVDPEETLLSYLRNKKRLTGTKLGCGEGGCGACSVIVSKIDPKTKEISHSAVNSCLTPLCAVEGCAITTVEGLRDAESRKLHPVQNAIAENHGSQCGFCTPGIVMALTAIVQHDETMGTIEQKMDGNLCRCTGYRPLLDAAKSFGSDAPEAKCGSAGCDKQCMAGDIEDILSVVSCSAKKIRDEHRKHKNMDLKLGFPNELIAYSNTLQSTSTHIAGHDIEWFRPSSLKELLAVKKIHPNAKISVGNTELAIEIKLKHMVYPVMISVSNVPELHALRSTPSGMYIGAAVPLTRLTTFCKKTVVEPAQTPTLKAIVMMLKWFASQQIRNVACLGGNLATASPIADMNPLLASMGAVLNVASATSTRQIPVMDFFVAYRKVALEPNEIIISIYVPYTKKFEYVFPFKQAKRREDDISIATAGLRLALKLKKQNWIVHDACFVFGGMGPTIKRAVLTEKMIKGKEFSMPTIMNACATLGKEFTLPVTVPGGMAAYRTTLSVSFLYKGCLQIAKSLGANKGIPSSLWTTLDPREYSATKSYMTVHRPVSRGTQHFGIEKGGLMTSKHEPMPATDRAPVGNPLMHRSAYLQVSGEAKYVDDMDNIHNVVHGALVLSSVAHANIVSIDAAEALKMDGVVAFLDAKVFKNMDRNALGPVIHDEECFASSTVVTAGQPLGIILATTHEKAVKAAEKVKVEYSTLPSIVSIKEAIAAQSFHTKGHKLERGDIAAGFATSAVIIEGESFMGGQEHFYLETNACYVTPMEDGGINVVSSTQATTKTQMCIAHCLGIPAHKVVSSVKRLGGGFGGKETRSVFVACAAAVAAQHLRRPVRLLLERQVDMITTGTRHPYYAKYKVGATKEGKVLAYTVELFNNAGYSLDLSEAVMDRALFHCENAYYIPNVRAVGMCCKTNLPTNTAFRGFGAPQGLMMAETMMDHLARELKMDPTELRSRNLYKDQQVTHFGQKLVDYHLPELWERALKESHFRERQEEVVKFNAENKWTKRGIAILPTKFGISFTNKFMNQGGSLVHVYADGSVLVSHGGTEMGQGLHTKVMQIVAKSFGISMDMVTIHETSTDKVANSQPSAASMSTDLYGMATLDACEQINARIAPVKARLGPNATFAQVVKTAYFERIDLSAHGFYIVPNENCGYDWTKSVDEQTSTAFNYFTTGVGVSQVEIDVLTGDVHMTKVDIYMDVGASINPAIDIGQIEGAFIQGFGLFCMEQHVWGDSDHPWLPRGALFTRGPGTYKIPSFNDVPLEMNIWLEPNKKNKFAVHSSKAIGEPPLFLGATAFFAIKDAIAAARKEHHEPTTPWTLLAPATSERVRMAIQDCFCADIPENDFVAYGKVAFKVGVTAMEAVVNEAELHYRRQQGRPHYVPIEHRGQPDRFPPFSLNVPQCFLPWNVPRRDVVAFPSTNAVLSTCRCGIVQGGVLYTRPAVHGADKTDENNNMYMVAVKIMDRTQLVLQRDDVDNEVRVMHHLQPGGFTGVVHNASLLQWEYSSDEFNEYIATDYVANGSLLAYSRVRLQQLHQLAIQENIPEVHRPQMIAEAWVNEGLNLFLGIVRGLTYIHAQDVAHLDLDPNNVVVDENQTPRILDFGSAILMFDGNPTGLAGGGTMLIKCKPLYAPPEVKLHNRSPPPREPFNGAAADMWAAGTLLYQLLCLGYPVGEYALILDANWRCNLLAHALNEAHGQAECYICVRQKVHGVISEYNVMMYCAESGGDDVLLPLRRRRKSFEDEEVPSPRIPLCSPLAKLMVEWDDLESVILNMRTPAQSIGELITSLESIDFSVMLEDDPEVFNTFKKQTEAEVTGEEEEDDEQEDDEQPIAEAFTLQDIIDAWGDEYILFILLQIPQRDQIRLKSVFWNFFNAAMPNIDLDKLSERRIYQLYRYAAKTIATFV